ncbi:hypothetical protein ES705_28459 [subsurface metagenome]
MQIEIDVRTLFEFTGRPVPDKIPPLADLETMVREQFSFLPQPIEIQFDGWRGIITYPEESQLHERKLEGFRKRQQSVRLRVIMARQ